MSTKVSTDLIDLSSNTGGLVWAKGTTAQQPASATAGEMRVDTTTNTTLVYNGTQWKTLKETAFVSPPVPTHFLVVAGGGGGGSFNNGGGGGAGGLRTSYGSTSGGGGSAESTTGISLNTAYTITVGSGGAGQSSSAAGGNGTNSLLSGSNITNIESTGGGGGGTGSSGGGSVNPGGNGGSGGGSGWNQTNPGTGNTGEGFAGGTGTQSGLYTGGGGGGAGEAGSTDASGEGGDGLAVSITGSSVTYAGGGGGGADNTGSPGGTGGGGAGAIGYGIANANSGVFNTGGGGGGGHPSSLPSGSGGPGVVILRYPTADLPYFTTTGTLNTPSATDTVADTAYPVTNLAYYKLDSNANDSGLGSGYIGQGAIFNGSSSVITSSSLGTALNVSSLSFSLWFKTNVNDSTDRILISSYDGSGNARFYASVLNSGLSVVIYPSSGSAWIQNFTSTVGIGNWYHLAVTHTGTTTTVYLNGTPITPSGTSGSAVAIKIAGSPQPITIGQLQGYIGTYALNGSIDQVRIYDTALSSSNVALLYAETSATSSTLNYPAGTGGIALYEFSGNANSTSSSAYNGTATNVEYVYNGTATDVTYENGRFNEAANFNGTSSKIVIPSPISNTSNVDFSISLWFRPNTTIESGQYQHLIGQLSDSARSPIQITLNGTGTGTATIGLWRNYGNVLYYSPSNPSQTFAIGQWYNISISYTASNSSYVTYVNGVSLGSNTQQSLTSATTANTLTFGTYNSSYWVNGQIDQVRIFSSALAAGDVEDLYNEHFPTKFTDGSDTALMFTGGTGNITFLDTDPNFAVDYLVVGGGGSAGVYSLGSSGGGAGGVKRTSNYGGSETPLAASIGTAYNVTVGPGGVSPTTDSKGNNGTSSLFNGVTSIGGGGGGGNGTTNFNGSDGASGGGGGPWDANQGLGGTGSNGFNGGTGNSAGSCGGAGCGGGGGGGFTSVGGNVNAATPNGGTGVEVNIIGGTGNFYAGGGAGAKLIGTNYALGGTGGSGVGGNSALASGGAGISGTVNTGSGGGGGFASTAGNGGSGVVIIRYPNTKTITVGAGLTATTAAVGTDSVTTFTAGTGTITFS